MKAISTLCASTILVAAAVAGDGKQIAIDKGYHAPEASCFKDQELQIDIFGQYTVGEGPSHAGPVRDHGWGGGIGINYFFTRNIGIGIDAAWLYAKDRSSVGDDDDDHTTIHNFSGSLIARFPIDDKCLAPYLYVGGGAAVDGEQWASAHAGAGLEFRVQPQKMGIFVDGRWTYYGDRFGHEDLNNFSGRVGVRWVF
jgi:opacity protein-like surface antigen